MNGRVELKPPLIWGRDNVGIGLIQALRSKRVIAFEDRPSSEEIHVAPKSNHLVVCERGDDLAQVIAANYAQAFDAGLFLISQTEREHSDDILERFYSVYDDRDRSATDALRELRNELRAIAGNIPIPENGSITFISDGLPFGFAFPEVPSTHLFGLDLGISIIHGFAAEQPNARGVQVAALVNPETTPAPEINAAARILSEQRLFARVYEGPAASVTSISEMVELFPYDLLVIATHCGDVSGYRWTYQFTDIEGIDRNLVVDIALGIGRTSEKDLLNVTQFMRFVSLDGVSWNDPVEKAKLYVGKAILDFMERTRPNSDNELKPVTKDTVDRVVGSAALKMYDNNFIAVPRSVASEGTPIVINNACVSWRRLATNFIFGGARGYVGTLFPISTTEAESVLLRALGKHRGKALPHAFWSAQRETYDDDARRPYVMAGVYTQRIRATAGDVPRHIVKELRHGRNEWTRYRDQGGPHSSDRKRTVDAHISFFERELEWFHRGWGID
ncbi:hypothetical protein NML43_23905 [Rhodopseudomonas palustris]|uniref:hypothetical protein n=1 Tax=Rhodopseudomonas palustris TaxID=1076 RepID=UPI0020CEBF0E|nr:hypothetical protein [Rhodopseudomonas palustris]MCP9630148.1 hypothetical protein [Rhodopseudomonas palustris]